MKIKIKKPLKEHIELLRESDIEGYSDIEEIRISIGQFIDRTVLTPKALMDMDKALEDTTEKDYLNRTRDIVKQGRKIPFLYYAYKGVDPSGNLMNQNDILPVLQLQQQKAGQLIRSLEMDGGGATILMFMCDFGNLITLHDEWDKGYEQRMRELLPKRTYERMAMKMGYDKAEFQAGRATNLQPFSTVAIGKGSKPMYAQNVDFMYKTSPEPNKNVQQNDLWAFSIRLPLALAYMSYAGLNKIKRKFDAQGNRIKIDRKALAQQRLLSLGPKTIIEAYSHWSQHEKEYRIQYAERMRQEGANWFQELPKLTLKGFNLNYVRSTTIVQQQRDRKITLPHFKSTPQISFETVLMQPPPLSLESREALLDHLDDSETSKKIAKYIIATMVNNPYDDKDVFVDKGTTIDGEFLPPRFPGVTQEASMVKNMSHNLQQLVKFHKNDSAIKKNITWIQHAIQQYYIMGGK